MIIIGYQGIGKSTLANKDEHYIDLESGNFWEDGKRHEDWYKYYCNIAEDLSRQGYNVFVSSHEIVRDRLKNSSEKVVCVVPSFSLKVQWIDKLKNRYQESKKEKDYKAWKNAEDYFTENIEQITHSGFDIITLQQIEYNLKHEIELRINGKSRWIENASEGQNIDPPYICPVCGYAEAIKSRVCAQCDTIMEV